MTQKDVRFFQEHLAHIIQQMQEHIDANLADGTLIPGWYEEIQSLLDKAKKTLKN